MSSTGRDTLSSSAGPTNPTADPFTFEQNIEGYYYHVKAGKDPENHYPSGLELVRSASPSRQAKIPVDFKEECLRRSVESFGSAEAALERANAQLPSGEETLAGEGEEVQKKIQLMTHLRKELDGLIAEDNGTLQPVCQ